MGFFAKKFAKEFEAELQLRLDNESEARENAKFLRELLNKERAEALFWRSRFFELEKKYNTKGGTK